MDEHQCVHSAGGDDVCCEHGFAEGGGRGKHAGIVRKHRGGGGFLFRAQSAGELQIQRISYDAFIANPWLDFQLLEKRKNFFETSARQGDVFG